MVSKIQWDALPSATNLILAAGALKNLANNAIAVSAEYANGTSLNRWGSFVLYAHDFAAAPSAGGYFECHIIYQHDTTLYADGEDGDLADPNLGPNTWVGNFAIIASDEDQRVQLGPIPLEPFDFKVCIVNKTGQAIANTDGSTLDGYFYTEESQ